MEIHWPPETIFTPETFNDSSYKQEAKNLRVRAQKTFAEPQRNTKLWQILKGPEHMANYLSLSIFAELEFCFWGKATM